MSIAKFIYDTSERCPDLYYASGFTAHDPYIFIESKGKKYLVMSDLEIDRAKKESSVHKVLSISKYSALAAKKVKKPDQIDIIDTILRDLKIKAIEVPPSTPFTLVDHLRKRKYKVISGQIPFYPQRLIKTKEEKKLIIDCQKVVFKTMGIAEEMLRSAKISKGFLYYKGKVLTSEMIREAIHIELLRHNFIAVEGTIVACGKDTMDPHECGKGPIRPNQAIIVDIFPRNMTSLFWGDATRTFCVGKAPEKLKELYRAVKDGQEFALKNIKAGVNGRFIHEGILNIFEKRGFRTGEFGGRMQGFFHSTGHGLGLEIHESPTRIGPCDMILKEGLVVSVEPGLYYKGIGGVRIEDLVYVTKTGCEILSHYPKKLEIL